MVDRQQRVVFVVPTYVGGGAERIVRMVADELAAHHGLAVEIVALLDGGDVDQRTAAGVDVRGLGAARVRNALWPLVRQLRADPPAAVVSTLKHVSIGLGMTARALPRETRHVARVANTYSSELAQLPARRSWLQRRLIRMSHRSIPYLVCVSAGVLDDLVEAFGIPASRCTVIPNPVDVEALRRLADEPAPELPDSVSGAEVRYLAVGRLEAQKDHETLLRAFSLVAGTLDASLVLAGEGSRRARLEALAAELGLADRVALVGFVPNPYPLYRDSHALVLSSRYEGLPNVLLEALALGIPCVSTDCPHGPREVLVEPRLGRLVPVGDVAELAAAMIDVASWDLEAFTGPEHVRRHHSLAAASRAYAETMLGPGDG